MNNDRYTRQRRLAEVGDAGQERIFHASFRISGSEAAELEADYLRRAGVEQLRMQADAAPEPFTHEQFFHSRQARDVAAGAWRALIKLRRALRVGHT